MTSTPILTARRPVHTGNGSLVGVGNNGGLPVKSILRDGVRAVTKAAQTGGTTPRRTRDNSNGLKRKLADRYDDSSDVENGVPMVTKKIKADEETSSDDDDADANEDDIGSDTGPVDQTMSNGNGKQAKSVHFDMSLNITTEVGRHSLAEIKRLVRRALEAHNAGAAAAGTDQDYLELMEVFSGDERRGSPHRRQAGGDDDDDGADEDDEDDDIVSPEELLLYVVALTSCTPLLKRPCVKLVRKLLAVNWLGRDDRFFRAYVQFLAALISAQGAYMRAVLEMVVDKFKEPAPASWAVPGLLAVDRTTAQQRMHTGLRYVLQLFPAARLAVCPVLASKFPFLDEPKSVHLYYVDNLLRLRGYAPELGKNVMEMITAQLVKIDTEFQLDLSDMDDDLVARVVFQLSNKSRRKALVAAAAGSQGDDIDDDDDDDDGGSGADDDKELEDDYDDTETVGDSDQPTVGDPDYDEEQARIDKSTRLVQKLDAVLDRMFGALAPVFADPKSDAAEECFRGLVSDFYEFVLTVPSSRHTQFLVFHFSQRSARLQDLFTGTLLALGFEANQPSAVRQAAAAYLSSYVARAARVPRKTTREVAQILCQRIEAFRRRHEGGCKGPDLRRYQELYAWVQALLYMFCFRWRDLVDGYPEALVDPEDAASYVGQELEWMPGLREALRNVIHAPFNPLLVCSQPIVKEFAKLAHALGLLYVFPRLESNKRVNLAQYASGRYGNGGALREDAGSTMDDDKRLQLEGNFPFDPYHLPVSKRWLEGDYLPWTPIPGLDGEEDDSSDEDDEDDEDDDEDDDEEEEEEDSDEDGDNGVEVGNGFAS